MYNYIWKIRRIGERYYEITLDPSSFAYDSFPESDRHWKNDNVEELMNKARIITQTNIQTSDPYGKIWEYANILFDVDEEVIQEVRHEGWVEVKTSNGCLVGCLLCLVGIIGMLIILLTSFCIF